MISCSCIMASIFKGVNGFHPRRVLDYFYSSLQQLRLDVQVGRPVRRPGIFLLAVQAPLVIGGRITPQPRHVCFNCLRPDCFKLFRNRLFLLWHNGFSLFRRSCFVFPLDCFRRLFRPDCFACFKGRGYAFFPDCSCLLLSRRIDPSRLTKKRLTNLPYSP